MLFVSGPVELLLLVDELVYPILLDKKSLKVNSGNILSKLSNRILRNFTVNPIYSIEDKSVAWTLKKQGANTIAKFPIFMWLKSA